MNVDDLPEALHQWPPDDHAILGVNRSAKDLEIKRAYAARIKRFKPERFPHHFRRLREAYERVRQINRWHAEDQDDDEGSLEPPADAISVANKVESAESEEVAAPPAFDERWERACAGGNVEVYAEYRDEVELRPTEAENYVRLFWLLMAFPTLDAGIDPIAWLCRGVGAGADPHRLAALIGEDLLHRPETAVQDAISEAIRSLAPIALRFRIAVQRWQALVVNDVDPFRFVRDGLATLSPSHDDAFVNVQLAAAETLLPEGRSRADLVRSLLSEALERGGDASPSDLDRLDRAVALAEQTAQKSQRSLPRHALRVAAMVNANAYLAAQYVMWEYAEHLAADPSTILDELAGLLENYPTGFYLVERGFGWLTPRNGRRVERDIEIGFWTVLQSPEFLRQATRRGWMFQFCIRFWVSPSQLRSAMEGRLPRSPLGAAADLMAATKDPVLELAWRIYALAWTDYEPDVEVTAGETTNDVVF